MLRTVCAYPTCVYGTFDAGGLLRIRMTRNAVMKKIILAGFGVLALFSTVALADVLAPNSVTIGDDGGKVFSKIVEVTGQTPNDFRGRITVSADATIFCRKDGACSITIKAP